MADNNILVRLTEKFANRVFHEFHPDHPHETANGHELLVTGGVIAKDKDGTITDDPRRVVKAARTPGVLGAIMQGVLEEVRDPSVQASPEPVDILDVVNGKVQPGYPASDAPASDAPAADATSDAPADAAADAAAADGSSVTKAGSKASK